ncbi:MAG: hypothetical protein U5L00_15685 [Desulfovermiculus sp.]|nr:hypothetical protein [Desulfovermiculus sp.]
MTRPLPIEYPGVVYLLMALGNARDPISSMMPIEAIVRAYREHGSSQTAMAE